MPWKIADALLTIVCFAVAVFLTLFRGKIDSSWIVAILMLVIGFVYLVASNDVLKRLGFRTSQKNKEWGFAAITISIILIMLKTAGLLILMVQH